MITDQSPAECLPDGLILNVFVPGRPRPKGSLDFVTASHVREANRHAKPWLKTVEAACRRMVASQAGRPGRWLWLEGYPFDGPVTVTTRFLFGRPAAPEFSVPATTATGDLDKLNRNVFDALTAARVYVDDSRVVELVSSARYCEPGVQQGVRITVRSWDCEGI